MGQGSEVNVLHAVGAYALFSLVLFVWLLAHRSSSRTIALYWLLFTWFCAIQAVIVWMGQLLPVPVDGMTYFEHARAIAASGFQPEVIGGLLRANVNNLGVNTYTLLEAGLIYLTAPSFALVHIANVFLGTMAVFYAARFATVVFGAHAQKYVIMGFVLYFAWYWHVLQNLREAPLLCAMGIAMVYYVLWWRHGRLRWGVIALVFGFIAVLFRAENVLLVLAVGGLALLYRHPSWIRRFGKALILVPPLALLALNLAFGLTYNRPWQLINSARESRMEGAHFLAIGDVSSYGDLLLQVPQTLRYFVVPIWPWELGDGLVFFKAYVHSLSTFVLGIVALIGVVSVIRQARLPSGVKRPLWALLLGFTGVAGLYSLIDIGAGVAARHSAFYIYALLASYVPAGFCALRNLSAQLVYGKSVRQRHPISVREAR